MNKSGNFSRTNDQAPQGEVKDFFNLQCQGFGYLSRVRYANTDHGKTLNCAINALRGEVGKHKSTYFDLRVTGKEAIDLIENVLWKAVDEGRKVQLAFRVGDFYPDAYARQIKDAQGRKTDDWEPAASIKGRLLLITFAKVDDEIVYQRASDEDMPAEGDGDIPDYVETPPQPQRVPVQQASEDVRTGREYVDRKAQQGSYQRASVPRHNSGQDMQRTGRVPLCTGRSLNGAQRPASSHVPARQAPAGRFSR